MTRKTFLAVLFGVLVLSYFAMAQSSGSSQVSPSSQMSQSSQTSQGGDEQQLKDMENKWAAAAKSGDTSTVDSMLSDKFVSTESDGSVHTKAESLDRMKKAKVTSSAVSDVEVHMVNPNIAIVTGVWKGSGTDADGKPFDATERFTDTWVRENGQWKAVGSESTAMKKPS